MYDLWVRRGGDGRGNLLGTVSQAAAVPTGAVIERRTNANGECAAVRWHAGLHPDQTDGRHASTAVGSLFRSSANVTWTYPAAFIAVTGDVDDADCWMTTAAAPGTTTVALRVIAAVTNPSALTFRAVATGRWL